MNKPPVIVHPGHPGDGGHAVPKPQPIKDPGKVIDPRHGGGGRIDHPQKGPGNRPITQKPLQGQHGRDIAPDDRHMDHLRDRGVENNIRDHDRGWNNHDRGYDWHRWGDRDMCHHWDGFHHWWGFYLADVYFWTIYWNDMYWWYDPYWHRYCYMRDGRWWWQDPDNMGVVYVYEGGAYYRYGDTQGGVVLQPDPTPPVDVPPGDPNPAPADPNAKTFVSTDGSRSVQVTGEARDAFLYDTAETPAFEPKYLGSAVNDVRFKLDGQQQLSQILLLTDNDGFLMFDKDGNPFVLRAASLDQPQGPTSSTVGAGLQKSAVFGALKAGSFAW